MHTLFKNLFENLSKVSITLVILLLLLSSLFIPTYLYGAEQKPIDSQLLASCPISTGFDFPVGKPNAKAYYNAQKFGKNNHLGEDWNGTGGGNSDLGDPVFAISDGVVVSTIHYKLGWGRVLRIVHNMGSKTKPRYIESVYAHLNEFKVNVGAVIKKGDLIGTIGNANGRYWAHLHLELRDEINLPLGGGYSKNTKGFLDPTKFIKANRVIRKSCFLL